MYGSKDLTDLQEMISRLATDRQELTQQQECKLRQVTHLSEMVADLKLQLDSLVRQDQYKTQLYGRRIHLLCMYPVNTDVRAFYIRHITVSAQW